jgi:hypothetical protein
MACAASKSLTRTAMFCFSAGLDKTKQRSVNLATAQAVALGGLYNGFFLRANRPPEIINFSASILTDLQRGLSGKMNFPTARLRYVGHITLVPQGFHKRGAFSPQ